MPKQGQQHTKYIYGLIDPRTHAIRYIGQTNCLDVRYADHCKYKSALNRNAQMARGHWVLNLAAEGLKPLMVMLQSVPWAEADEAERRWIALGARLGWQLLNSVLNPKQLDLLVEERMNGNGSGSDKPRLSE